MESNTIAVGDLISTSEAARLLGVTPSYLRHQRAEGALGLPWIRVSNVCMYEREAVLATARERKQRSLAG